jgi:hypothetical protein
MTEWMLTFDYPAGDEWLALDAHLPDGAERVAQRIADRGGQRNKRYAKAALPELRTNWRDMRAEGLEPFVMYVPQVRRNARPLLAASAFAVRSVPENAVTMELLVEKMHQPTYEPEVARTRERKVTTVELPVGPACRIHDAPLPGRPPAAELVQHYVLAKEFPQEFLMIDVTWVSGAVGPGMVELADRMAASLRYAPRDSGEGPRPVLAAPEAPIVFDEVQIGKGLRPLAQHGFVTIEQGVLTLLNSDQQPIDTAPLANVRGSKRGITGGTVVSLTLNGTKYNVSPGWGANRQALPIPGLGNPVKDSADALMQLIERGGGTLG